MIKLATINLPQGLTIVLSLFVFCGRPSFPISFSSAGPRPHPVVACGVLKEQGATYVLENDVSAEGTCFSVQADKVSLNLNGKTITYGTSVANIPVYGILGVACWDPDFGVGNRCGGSSENLTVYGGTITQSPGVAPFSHGIRLGQGPKRGPTIHDVIFNISADSSIPIYATYIGEAEIYGNTINNGVRQIKNRHQLQGQAIKLADGTTATGPTNIYKNRITGGAQGGILSGIAGTKIHDNVISQSGVYTNDFGIYAVADGGEVYSNIVTPTLGRGIYIGYSIGAKVHDNTIVVIEQKDNEEYGGCQSGGTFGIQFDDNPKRAVAVHNSVVAKADQCGAQALRVTESLEGSGNASHDNQYVAERVGNSEAFATGFGSGGAKGFASEHDFFSGDTSVVRIDWEGGSNLVFRNCTFARGSNPAPNFATFSFRNGHDVPVTNIHFIDSTFQNGAAKNDTDMRPILSEGDWPGTSEYFIDWTLKVSIQNQKKETIAGVSVEIENGLGENVFRGLTGNDGNISVVLNELRVYNTSSQVIKQSRNPYLVRVHKDGCQAGPDGNRVNLTGPAGLSISLDCPK